MNVFQTFLAAARCSVMLRQVFEPIDDQSESSINIFIFILIFFRNLIFNATYISSRAETWVQNELCTGNILKKKKKKKKNR